MNLRIVEETPAVLAEYEKIPIAFVVKTRFRAELLNDGLSGVRFVEEPVETPFLKDYDALDEDRPTCWARRFELKNWGILSAFDGAQRIGGAAVAWKTPEVFMLEDSLISACLWDLRVAPEYRGKGVGKSLFENAANWAKQRNCRFFKVETQNINVPACRFYARRGCHLGGFNLHAYPEWMNEIQMLWYRNL